jgi:L-arabinose isomerase
MVAPANLKRAASATNHSAKARASNSGLRAFLTAGGFKGFTTTFEDLHGLVQLPGLAPQRLMADGYGFGWRRRLENSALVRAMKVMASGLKGGTSFMEDYTYHLQPNGMQGRAWRAHAGDLSEHRGWQGVAGGASARHRRQGRSGARLVFNTPAGPALNAAMMDFGNRFRLLVNEVDVVKPEQAVAETARGARHMEMPSRISRTRAAAWIYAGGAHHTGFSQAVTTEQCSKTLQKLLVWNLL